MINMRLDGIKGLEQKLKNLSKEMSDGIQKDMQEIAVEINGEQKSLAPVNKQIGLGGTLRSRIAFDFPTKLTTVFTAATDYAAYVEFGTGGLVNVPPSLEKEAIQYKGRGIRQVNMNAQPYFFQPIFKGKNKLIAKIKARFK